MHEAFINKYMNDCTLCPRKCHANRTGGQTGYCGQTAVLRAARAALHYWEEPCISGTFGSGAVFFSGCPLRCVYCQNHHIAAGNAGIEITAARLTEIFLKLQDQGAANINLVTPSHFVPQLVCALYDAKGNGLRIPVVYNTSSYENADTLRMLDGLVDIYLPDLKYTSPVLSARYSNAPDYFSVACEAISEMVRQTGEPVFAGADGRSLNARQMNEKSMDEAACEEDFLMKRGVIVRHLALPGQQEDSRRVLAYLHETYGDRIYISIMNQYTPLPELISGGPDGRTGKRFPELLRKLTVNEYEALTDYAISLGIENGFLQEGETAKESFIPAFDGEGLNGNN